MSRFYTPLKLSAIAILLSSSYYTLAAWSVIDRKSEPAGTRANAMTIAQNSQEALVREVHQQINQYRQSLNLSPLTLNEHISRQAEMHSRNMAQGQVKFSHQGFESRLEAIEDYISYRSAAENVAYNQGYGNPAERAVTGWIESKGHRQNIVGDYNLTGIGIAQNERGEYYFTQIFIKE